MKDPVRQVHGVAPGLPVDHVNTIDCMVNEKVTAPLALRPISRLVVLYVGIVIATLVALGVLSAAAPEQATSEAWGHVVIVMLFAVLLPLRLRSARHGDRQAGRAVGIIAAVLALVNVVEAAIPGFVPPWMRIEMVLIAALMTAIAALSLRPSAASG